MIVADANIVLYLLVQGPFTKLAQRAFALDGDWRLPTLWRYEFVQGVLMMVLAGQLDLKQALEVLRRGFNLFSDGEHDVSGEKALELAMRHRVSGYDAHYIALADALGVRCVTEDRKLRERTPALTASLSRFLNG